MLILIYGTKTGAGAAKTHTVKKTFEGLFVEDFYNHFIGDL